MKLCKIVKDIKDNIFAKWHILALALITANVCMAWHGRVHTTTSAEGL